MKFEKMISGIFKDKKFTTDTLWLISSQGILIISGFLVNLIIGYQFGAATLGVFNQVLGYYLILSTFFSLGINNTLIQKISTGDPKIHPVIFSSNFAITSLSTVFFSCAVLMISNFFPSVFSSPELAYGIFIATISLPFFNWNKNFMAYATGIRDQKLFANIRSFRWVVIITWITMVILLSKDQKWLYFSFLFSELLIFFFSLLRFSNLFTIEFKFSDLKNHLTFGLKSFTAEVFSILNDKLDLIIIGYFLANSEVGVYSFFIFFSKSLYIFPGILQQNINPIIGKHWISNSMEALGATFKNIRNINSTAILIQAIMILIFYKVLTDFYKPEFADSLKYLALSMVGIIPFALISWGGSILVMTGKLKANIIRTLILLIFTVLTTFIFTFLFGFIGSVWAIVVNGVFAFLLLFGFVKKETGIRLV